MKSNKELVMDFIQKYYASGTANEIHGLSTVQMADKLNMQRTNLSAILNQLVEEGKLEKSNGRPVLYRLKQSKSSGEFSCFKNLIGYDRTLKQAVQLAKASVLYPQHALHSLIVGPSGSGKSYFAKLMYTFAQENNIIGEDAPFVRFNCMHFSDNNLQMTDELFGIDKAQGALRQANGGFLIIDHADLLASNAKKILVDLLENNYSNLPEPLCDENLDVTIILCINSEVNNSNYDFISNKVSVKINLVPITRYSFNERLEFVQHFFMMEATKISRNIKINSELLRCLLLYECTGNIKQLSTDIRMGCANGYVREFQNKDKDMRLYISDFPPYVKQGFLEYKNYKEDVERVVPENYEFVYSEFDIATNEVIKNLMSYTNPPDIYARIERKSEELRERGISEEDINMIVSVDIDTIFKDYMHNITSDIVNTEQLAKIVDERIIQMVSTFINKASKEFERVYPTSVFYGLCLHLNETLNRKNKTQRLTNEQIMQIVEKNNAEYTFAMSFASEFELKFDMSLPIDEVVFITMFICDNQSVNKNAKHPVVLFAMHGENTATSIANVVNMLVKASNCYGYDMSLDKDPKESYKELKELCLNISMGRGIIMIYDMGSFKTMVDMIIQETGLNIRLVEMPITLFGIDCSRKASMGDNVDEIYDDLIENYNGYLNTMNISSARPSKKTIITLCMSGEGGAVQIKSYLESNLDLEEKHIEVIPLAISDRDQLLKRVNEISKESEIICVVGSFNPYLFNIRYISIAEIFNVPMNELETLIFKNDVYVADTIDYDSIYNHLKTKLDGMDMDKLRGLLTTFVKDVKQSAKDKWSDNQEAGLVVHVACLIYRLLQGVEGSENIYKDAIIHNYANFYKELKKIVAPIEKAYGITFDDNELSIMISIILRI